MRPLCATQVLPMWPVPLRSDSKGMELSPALPIYWYHSKGNCLRYNFAADSFYIMKLCSRLFVLYCRNCPKDNKFRYFIPHFEEVRDGVEPWSMARWKARVWLPVRHNWTFFASSYGWGATRQNVSKLAAFRRGRSLGAKISGGRGSPPANILIPLERQLTALQPCRWHFYTMKLCSRLFVLYCRNCPNDDKFRYLIPILRKLGAA